jgi:hypothetical protein
MIQTIAQILLMIIMIPCAILMTMVSLPMAVIAFPLVLLMALANGDSLNTIWGFLFEVAFLGFHIIFN